MGPIQLTHNNTTDMPSATACKNHGHFASHAHVDQAPFIDGAAESTAAAQRDHGSEQGRWSRAEPLGACLQTASNPNRSRSTLAMGRSLG